MNHWYVSVCVGRPCIVPPPVTACTCVSCWWSLVPPSLPPQSVMWRRQQTNVRRWRRVIYSAHSFSMVRASFFSSLGLQRITAYVLLSYRHIWLLQWSLWESEGNYFSKINQIIHLCLLNCTNSSTKCSDTQVSPHIRKSMTKYQTKWLLIYRNRANTNQLVQINEICAVFALHLQGFNQQMSSVYRVSALWVNWTNCCTKWFIISKLLAVGLLGMIHVRCSKAVP